MAIDRSRVPPDVARRLVALAAHLRAPGGDVPQGAPASSVDAPPVLPATGWTPRRPVDAPVPRQGPAPDAPEPAPDDVPAGTPPASEGAAGPGAEPWQLTVTSALTAAAATLPPPPVRTRWAPGWRAAGAAVLALALAVGGIVLRAAATPRGEPVAVPTPAVSGPAPAVPEGGAPGPAASDQVVVHVVGAVAQPGVVRLALGARVADAIAAAGGSAPGAELAAVNLARVLSDGEQLVVPVAGAPVALPPGGGPGELLDLNTADAAALEGLPGVGPVLAERIVQHRTERPFRSPDELDEVPGIGPALLADLRPRVRV